MDPIKKLIKEHGRSVVAKRLGVSRALTYKWELGKVTPERAIQIEKEFGCNRRVLRPDIWSVETDGGVGDRGARP